MAREPLNSCAQSTALRVRPAKLAGVGEKYLEDFAVRQVYGSGRLKFEESRIKSFAAEFDPQPFHLDGEAAQVSVGNLVVPRRPGQAR